MGQREVMLFGISGHGDKQRRKGLSNMEARIPSGSVLSILFASAVEKISVYQWWCGLYVSLALSKLIHWYIKSCAYYCMYMRLH